MSVRQTQLISPGKRTPVFGDLLRELRLAAGLTQEELAERATLSLRGISDLERGVKTRPQRETIRLLADALALTDADRKLFEDVARHRVSPDPIAPTEPAQWPETLPEPSRPFLGREMEVERVITFITDPATRAVTITGPGGVGKTRLAIEVAGNAATRFADGATFVSLAAVRDAGLVAAAIATTLGITAQRDEPIRETLLASIETKTMLLVLDNFEQVTAAASFVGALLLRCPHVTVLATSRVPLHVRGEREYPLSPLPLPDPAPATSVGGAMGSAAVALFVARAQQAKPDFTLTDANAATVATICVQLDGLPLAIELAAARVRLLPPAAMAARLESRLNVLAGGTETLPARQRTMRDAIAWSYDLLEAREQRLFRLLSTCIGGCTVDAAEALWGSDDPTANVLGWIDALADKSLLTIEEHPDEVRLVMLEVIREFAAERLAAEDDEQAVRLAHAEYYRDLAWKGREEVRGKDQARWLALLEQESANFRAAMTWARYAGELDIAVRIAANLRRFWFMRAHYEEGQTWLESLLALDANAGYKAQPNTRAAALNGAAYFALDVSRDYAQSVAFNTEALKLWQEQPEPNLPREADTLDALAEVAKRQGDTARAKTLLEESLVKRREAKDKWGIADTQYRIGWLNHALGDLASATQAFEECIHIRRHLGDKLGTALAQHGFADIVRIQGDTGRAQAMLMESLETFRELGDRGAMASALTNLGIIAESRGELALSVARHEEALAIFRELGNRGDIANTLNNLGYVVYRQGDLKRASELCEQALAISRELDDQRGIAFGMSFLGGIAEAAGETDRAARLFADSLTLCNALGSKIGVMDNLESLARVATTHGRAVEAARLFGAAEAIRAQEKLRLSPADEEVHDRAVVSCCALIGEEAFQSALAEGLMLRLDAAVPEAMSVIDTVSLAAAATREDTLGQLARVFQRLTQGGAEREQQLKREVQKLRIEIDEVKKERAVAEIADSDYFHQLQERARRMRKES